jgi:RHS repeat-associated protein
VHFDSDGRVTQMVDRNGHAKTFEYDQSGLLVAVEADADRITFEYEGERLVQAQLSDGRSVSYRYENDLLVEVVDLRGNLETYSYDHEGRVERVVDNAGQLVVENTYDDDHRVVFQRDAFGASYHLEYLSEGAYDVTIYADPLGNRQAYVYSGERLVRTTDALDRTTTLRYDDDLNLVEVVDAFGARTTASYDADGLPTRIEDALGNRTEMRWGPFETLTELVDADGARTAFTYDDQGNLSGIEGPDGAVVTYDYDDAPGLVTQVTDPLGATTSFEYDSLGQFAAMVTATGSRTEVGYDEAGNVVTIVDPVGFADGNDPDDHTWTLEWDETGRVTQVIDPHGTSTAYTYDAMSRLTSVTDGNGSRIVYEYDARGRATEVIASDGTSTRYVYDVVGNLIQRIDATGAVTQYGYDEVGQLVGVVSPAFQRWTYDYDEVGNLVEIVTPEGLEGDAEADGRVEITYDELGRPVSVGPSDAPDVDLEWSPTGRLTVVEDALGRETWSYDDAGRLVEVARGDDRITYGHDAAGRLVERIVDGAATTYGYDEDGRLTQVTSDDLSAEYAYDAAGRMVESLFGNGARVQAAWDRAGRLVKVTHQDGDLRLLESLTYAYDAAGNPREVRGIDEILRYRYDQLDRLVQSTVVSRGTGAELAQWTYQYDDAGRRVAERGPADEVTLLRFSAGDQLREIEPADGSVLPIEYDDNGRRVAVGDERFVYDVLDRLIEHEVDGVTTEFVHDGLGRRVAEHVDGEPVKGYRWDPNALNYQLAALVGPDGDRQEMTLLPGVATLGISDGDVASYLHADGLGTTIATTTGDGSAGWRYGYEPFGAERFATQLDDGAPGSALRFTGELLDEASGDYHLRLRQYDPTVGQFASLDPVGSFQHRPYSSVYGYVDNRPTVWTDPSGACPWCITAAIGAGIGAAVGAATNAVVQLANDEPFSWGELGAAAAGGAVAGGLAGATGGLSLVAGTSGATFVGANAVIGAGSSLVGNSVNQGLNIAFNDGSWSWGDFAFSGVTGGVFGVAGGSLSRSLQAPGPTGSAMSPHGAQVLTGSVLAGRQLVAGTLFGVLTHDGGDGSASSSGAPLPGSAATSG